MKHLDFVQATILSQSDESFHMLKKALIGEYLTFSILDDSEITKEILAEKVCDYFETLELKTGKTFEKHLESYLSNLGSIVSPRVAKVPQPKKKGQKLIEEPRARKYFEKALSIKDRKPLYIRQVLDYSRLMMCLYMAVIKNNHKDIDNFDYSIACLDLDMIIASMKEEQEAMALNVGRKKRFEIKEKYCSDTSTFIIAIIIFFKIADEKVQGEYYHE